MTIVRGIDVSSHQDPSGSGDRNLIDWSQVAPTPYDFALARMSIGRSTRDEDGRQNLAAMLGRIPIAGAYGVVGYADPVEDGADLLVKEIRAVGVDPADILVMLDAEDFGRGGPHPTIDQVDRYAKRLRALLGRWPVAYVPDWWLDGHGYTVAGRALAECPWAPSEYIAAPFTEARITAKRPASLHGFKRLGWLQFTSSGTVAGISGRVDLNAFYGTLTQLKAQLLGQEADMPLTADEINAVADATADKWQEKYGQRLAQWAAGKPNQVYNVTALGVPGRPASTADTAALATLVQGEGDQTQAAIATLQVGGADPAAIAAAVIAGLGPDLAGQLAAELAVRLSS